MIKLERLLKVKANIIIRRLIVAINSKPKMSPRKGRKFFFFVFI